MTIYRQPQYDPPWDQYAIEAMQGTECDLCAERGEQGEVVYISFHDDLGRHTSLKLGRCCLTKALAELDQQRKDYPPNEG